MSCHAVQRARARPEPISKGEHLRLDSKPPNVGAARRFVQEQLAGYPEATVEDASLLVSELATNALVHVGTSFVVGVIADESEVLVAVTDERHDRVPFLGRMPAAEDIVEMSRGIAIVSLIASDFGWHLLADSPGKVVWFTLDRGEGEAPPMCRSAALLKPAYHCSESRPGLSGPLRAAAVPSRNGRPPCPVSAPHASVHLGKRHEGRAPRPAVGAGSPTVVRRDGGRRRPARARPRRGRSPGSAVRARRQHLPGAHRAAHAAGTSGRDRHHDGRAGICHPRPRLSVRV